MIQFYAFGSSFEYGVGGEDGGWADILKRRLHKRMYGPDGVGEKYELYNFAQPGATIDFVRETAPEQVARYRRENDRAIALVSVGGNNVKAVDRLDNFVSTPEEYRDEMSGLLSELKSVADRVIFVGSGPVDESKTNPKPNPLTGGCSYFSNERMQAFEAILVDVCDTLSVEYVPVGVFQDEWVQSYLAPDGLHPNGRGYELIAERVWELLEDEIK